MDVQSQPLFNRRESHLDGNRHWCRAVIGFLFIQCFLLKIIKNVHRDIQVWSIVRNTQQCCIHTSKNWERDTDWEQTGCMKLCRSLHMNQNRSWDLLCLIVLVLVPALVWAPISIWFQSHLYWNIWWYIYISWNSFFSNGESGGGGGGHTNPLFFHFF